MIHWQKLISQSLFKKIYRIDKHIRFLISTIILSSLMLLSTFFFFDKAIIFIPILALTAYFLTYFSLLEGIEKIEWQMLFLIPVLFTVTFYLFLFLFPIRWITRIPFLAVYAVSIYALLRTTNIFNVGVEKSLQLYRAAFSVNFFYHTAIVFFLGNFFFSLKFNSFINGFAAFGLTSVLAIHLLWTVRLKLNYEKETMYYALFIGLVLGEMIAVLSFFSFETSILAILLTACYYSLVGLTYAYLDQRLFKETVREYSFVVIFIFIITFLTSFHW